MEVFVILESYTDYKGGNATSWGVFTTKESAIKAMPQVILNRCGYDSIEDFEDFEGAFDDYFCDADRTHWSWDRDDNLIEFYIQSDDLYYEVA